uniref:Uncharacterized protein n=1 Tax=Rhizophora mucronata TaxID=61149 RepID=A0A2P2N4X4_RHIMU
MDLGFVSYILCSCGEGGMQPCIDFFDYFVDFGYHWCVYMIR